MSTELSLNTTESQAIAIKTPRQEVQEAVEWGQELMEVVDHTVDKNGKPLMFVNLSGNKYLKVEAWQLIGKFAGVAAETDVVEPVIRNDEIVGYQAKVNLVKLGSPEKIGGGAVGYCGLDSHVQKGQYTEDGKTSAVMSMAQTRATSKAFRLNYAFVAQFGGYEALPWEEVTDEMKAKGSPLVQHAQSQGAEVVEVKPKVEVITTTVEPAITSAKPQVLTEATPPEFILCPLHNESMSQRDGNYGVYYSHMGPNEKWCNCNYDKPKITFQTEWVKTIETTHGASKAEQVKVQAPGQNLNWWLAQLAGQNTPTEQCMLCDADGEVEIENGVWTCIEHEEEYRNG